MNLKWFGTIVLCGYAIFFLFAWMIAIFGPPAQIFEADSSGGSGSVPAAWKGYGPRA